MFLRNLQAVQRCASLFPAAFAAMSEALHSDRFFEGLSTLWVFAFPGFAAISLWDAAACRCQRSLEFYTSF
jgi:hypothetical protein